MVTLSQQSRIRRWYTASALTIVNAAVMLAALNLVAWAALTVRDAVRGNEASSELRAVYPGMTDAEITVLFKETWDQPWEYQPWVGFRERPREGRFVNISKQGFRFTHSSDLTLEASGLHVYVFGGSTVFGYGIDDASTIPAHLQAKLEEWYPGQETKVFNFGRGFYYSTQELALLLQLLRNGHVPDIALFIDGLNEGQPTPYYTGELTTLFEAYNYSRGGMLTLAVGRLAEQNSLVRIARRLLGLSRQRHRGALLRDDRAPEDKCREYLDARRVITLLATEYGFDVYFFIHPVPGYRNPFAHHMFTASDLEKGWDRGLLRMMQLLDATVDNTTSFTLTGVLQDYSSRPFIDECHFTPEVCEMIGTEIARRLRIPPNESAGDAS